MQNNYRVKGAFFENMKPTGPAFTGFVEIDGVRTEIALWPKTSQKGTNYFQVSEDKGKKKPAQPGSFAPAPQSSFTGRQYSQPTTGRQPQSVRGPSTPKTTYNDMDSDDISFTPEWR